MSVEIVVPTLGESVTEAIVAKWLKSAGEAVAVDEPLVELGSDKVTLEVNATVAGTLGEIKVEAGGNVEVGAILGMIEEGAAPAAKPAAAQPAPPAAPVSAPEPAPKAPSLSPAANYRRPMGPEHSNYVIPALVSDRSQPKFMVNGAKYE